MSKLLRFLLPMPAAAVCWFFFGKVADANLGLPREGTGPSFSSGMDVLALVLLFFVGGVLQLCIGRPIVRRLAAQRAPLKRYWLVGFLVGLALLAVAGGLLLLTRPPFAELLSLPVVMASVALVAPVVVFYAVAGVFECHDNTA
jgi:hypothetical protein